MTRLALLGSLVLHATAFAQIPTSATDDPRVGIGPAAVQVLTAQVMLDRAGFSPGVIDGHAGPNLQRAVDAFQRERRLPVTGRVDELTFQRLLDDSGQQPTIVVYTLTDADVAGPFQPDIPDDLVEQSKLQTLGYRNPLEALAEKFHSSPALLTSLNGGPTFDRAGEQIAVPNVILDDALTAPANTSSRARIVVTKRTSALTVEDAEGRALFHAPVTTGSRHDPLPVGRWKVNGVEHLPIFHYNPRLFWDADPSHSKARIAAGPNNPVGVAWIDISKPHYGIHGTPEPSTVGHAQSHGCVRMTNWDVRRLLQWAKPGTLVIFQ